MKNLIGRRIFLPGHFDVPVVPEDARPLGSDDSAGDECRVRLPDGSLEEAVLSAEEVVAALGKGPDEIKAETPVDAEKLRLPVSNHLGCAMPWTNPSMKRTSNGPPGNDV
jgi:hypothetical protein